MLSQSYTTLLFAADGYLSWLPLHIAYLRKSWALTFQNHDLPLFEVLASRQEQYQDVTPAQILDLLEEAEQTYAIVAPTLPSCLQNSAKV